MTTLSKIILASVISTNCAMAFAATQQPAMDSGIVASETVVTETPTSETSSTSEVVVTEAK